MDKENSNQLTEILDDIRNGSNSLLDVFMPMLLKAIEKTYFTSRDKKFIFLRNRRNNQSLLNTAIQYGHLDIVKQLLNVYHVEVNNKSNSTPSALFQAASYGHFEILDYLLNHRNFLRESISFSPFFAAINKNHLGIAQHLFDFADRFEFRQFELGVLLTRAVRNENREMIKFLLTKKANPNLLLQDDKLMMTRLFGEAHMFHLQRFALEEVDINKQNAEGNTCLMVACMNNDVNMIHFMIGNGANIDFTNEKGYNAVLCAIDNKSINAVKILHKSGAKLTRFPNGRTPLEQAAFLRDDDVYDFIKTTGWHKQIHENKFKMRLDEINALELLGAKHFLFDHSKTVPMWKFAFEQRLRQASQLRDSIAEGKEDLPMDFFRKCFVRPLSAYNHRTEFESIEQLESLEKSRLEMHFQTLLVKQRILGSMNPDFQDELFEFANIAASKRDMNTCFSVMKYLLRLRTTGSPPFCEKTNKMFIFYKKQLNINKPSSEVSIEQLLHFLNLLTIELRKAERTCPVEYRSLNMRLNRIFNQLMKIALYVCGCLCRLESNMDDQQPALFQAYVNNLLQAKFTDLERNSVLHLVFRGPDLDRSLLDYNRYREPNFPYLKMLRLLLLAGADINAINISSFAPLDLAATHYSDAKVPMARYLIKQGAELDLRNPICKQALKMVSGREDLFNFSLTFLCIRTINQFKLDYESYLPESFQQLISDP